MDGGGCLDRDLLALRGALSMTRCLRAMPERAATRFIRTQEVHQVGDVVGAHVEHGTAARLEEEVRVGMPVFHAAAHDVGGAAGDLADEALVHRLAGELVRSAEEGVGCTATCSFFALAMRCSWRASARPSVSGFSV